MLAISFKLNLIHFIIVIILSLFLIKTFYLKLTYQFNYKQLPLNNSLICFDHCICSNIKIINFGIFKQGILNHIVGFFKTYNKIFTPRPKNTKKLN